MEKSPFEEFASALDLKGLRIRNFPSLIFLCGGPTEDGARVTGYARDSFHKYVQAKHPELNQRFILAERVTDWVNEDSHRDLLSLEEDLARLSVLTVLFLESAGSIAELGAFSLLEGVREKLLPVSQNRYSEERSFINLGPLRRLQGRTAPPVPTPSYPWTPPSREALDADPFSEDNSADLVEKIQSHLSSEPKERVFDRKDDGHLMLLLSEFVGLLTISRLSDLSFLVDGLGLSIPARRLKQFIFLLCKLGIIVKYKYSSDQYYLSPESATYLSYSFVPQAPHRDRVRWQQLFLESYRSEPRGKQVALRAYNRGVAETAGGGAAGL